MDVTLIDGANLYDHEEKLLLIYGRSADELSGRSGSPDRQVMREILGTMNSVESKCGELCGASVGDVAVWLVTGGPAHVLLGDLPVLGYTLLDGSQVTIALTWGGNWEMLGRVLGHELCHAVRIKGMRLRSQASYVRYLADSVARLYEELLAIATEKWLYPHLSWEAAAGVPYSPTLDQWIRAGFLNGMDLGTVAQPEVLDELLAQHFDQRDALLYYIAYRLCSTRNVLDVLPYAMGLDAVTGLLYLSAPPGTVTDSAARRREAE